MKKAIMYAVAMAASVVPLSMLNFRCDAKLNYESNVSLYASEQASEEVEIADRVDAAWQHLYVLGARSDVRARDAFERIVDPDGDGLAPASELEEGIDAVFNPASPIGKLWFDAPSNVPISTYSEPFRGYEKWLPVARYLMDSSGDGRISEVERQEAAYKLAQ